MRGIWLEEIASRRFNYAFRLITEEQNKTIAFWFQLSYSYFSRIAERNLHE